MGAVSYLPVTLVLSGGGARGFAHVGVLRALEEAEIRPSALVGVSMGAVVSTTYAMRTDWYDALLEMDTSRFPHPVHAESEEEERPLIRRALNYAHVAWNMVHGWGAPPSAVEAGRAVLARLLGPASLEDGRVPVAVCATDLTTGRRVTMRSGNASDAVYASAALAGVLPPFPRGDHLLADGAYADIAPIDVARDFGHPVVIVVDPSQAWESAPVTNGLQSLMRATEICHLRHAELRMREADVVLRPDFGRSIDVLDFDARYECVEAGAEAVAQNLPTIRDALHLACLRQGVAGRGPHEASASVCAPGRAPVRAVVPSQSEAGTRT